MRGLVVRLALAACASAAALPVGAAAEPPAQGYIVYDVHPWLVRLPRWARRATKWKLDKGALRSRSRSRPRAPACSASNTAAATARWTAKACAELFGSTQRGRKAERAEFDWTAGQGQHPPRRRGAAQQRDPALATGICSACGTRRAKVVESGKPARFAVITNKSIKQAVVEPRGGAPRARRRLDTVRLHPCREGRPRDIDIWLSRRHSLLPVRIRITDDKGGVLDQRGALRIPEQACPPPGTRTEMKPRPKSPGPGRSSGGSRPADRAPGRGRGVAHALPGRAGARRRARLRLPGRRRAVAPFRDNRELGHHDRGLHRRAVRCAAPVALAAPHPRRGGHAAHAAGLVRARGRAGRCATSRGLASATGATGSPRSRPPRRANQPGRARRPARLAGRAPARADGQGTSRSRRARPTARRRSTCR